MSALPQPSRRSRCCRLGLYGERSSLERVAILQERIGVNICATGRLECLCSNCSCLLCRLLSCLASTPTTIKDEVRKTKIALTDAAQWNQIANTQTDDAVKQLRTSKEEMERKTQKARVALKAGALLDEALARARRARTETINQRTVWRTVPFYLFITN